MKILFMCTANSCCSVLCKGLDSIRLRFEAQAAFDATVAKIRQRLTVFFALSGSKAPDNLHDAL